MKRWQNLLIYLKSNAIIDICLKKNFGNTFNGEPKANRNSEMYWVQVKILLIVKKVFPQFFSINQSEVTKEQQFFRSNIYDITNKILSSVS
jgi:hypothetical protein